MLLRSSSPPYSLKKQNTKKQNKNINNLDKRKTQSKKNKVHTQCFTKCHVSASQMLLSGTMKVSD